ncbi:translocation protein SEC62-like [Gigantopelta aegis]|uniref:translocation protein SEC62-like n=1 Tax=Gigantopelta aegis TaxID=1735272 RepID=UPI001B8886D0|nr:translocation protein SEC62-like [Gigantopelta aegis]
MAERKKSRKKVDEVEPDKPTKEEYAVAKFLRFNCPVRDGKLVGMEVKCFFASKAVDTLLESKWSSAKMKKDALFTTRASCVTYCNRLLQKGLFHRAEKVERKKDRDKSKKKKKLKEGEKEEESNNEDVKEKKTKKDKKSKKETDGEKVEEEEKKDDGEKKEKSEEKKKKGKRLKLSMHDDQRFVDGEEIYVWIYDPVPLKTFLIGLLMVFGAIGLCLFPLWPEEVRIGVYYISLAAAGFVGFILSLVVVRLVLFCIIWVFTLGKHHFWLLPNLTEDVGFFDSFKPLYKHDLRKDAQISTDKKDKIEDGAKGDKGLKDEQDGKSGEKEELEGSAGAQENGENGVNGEFEIVEKDDLEEETGEEEEEERSGSEEETETKEG